MTGGNGAQRGKGTGKARPSARLALSPEDSWRDWSSLPGGEVAEDGTDGEDEDEIDLDDLSRLGGSMMVVGPAPGVADRTASSSPAADDTTRLPSGVTAPGSPRPPSSGRPAASIVDTTEIPIIRPGSPRPADGPAPLSTPAPAAPPRARAPRPVAATPVAPVPTPAAPVVAASVVAAPAAPAPAAAEPVVTGLSGLPVRRPHRPAEPAAARDSEEDLALDAALVGSTPDGAELVARAAVGTPTNGEGAAPAMPVIAPVPDPAMAAAARREAPRVSAALAFVLDSDPRTPRIPVTDPPAQPASAAPQVPRRVPAPRPVAGQGSDGSEFPSVSGLVADAVGLLESRVAEQQAETAELLAVLEARYTLELSRLDQRLREEFGHHGPEVPKEFEDKVYAGFMELVARVEHLEATPVPAPAAPIADKTATAAIEAVAAFLLEQHQLVAAQSDELVKRVARLESDHAAIAQAEEYARRLDRLETDQHALGQQNVQLAEGQQYFVSAQHAANEQFDQAMAQIAALQEQVNRATSVLPAIERRVAGLETRVEHDLAGLSQLVKELADRFPAVEEAAELSQRNRDGLADLQALVESFGAGLETDLTEVRGKLAELDGLREETDRIAGHAEETRSEFVRLEAEVDRRSSETDRRLVELEDLVGNEAGVDRNMLLDRLEEIERGIVELDPARFATRTELDQLSTRLPGGLDAPDAG